MKYIIKSSPMLNVASVVRYLRDSYNAQKLSRDICFAKFSDIFSEAPAAVIAALVDGRYSTTPEGIFIDIPDEEFEITLRVKIALSPAEALTMSRDLTETLQGAAKEYLQAAGVIFSLEAFS